jgi:hypothetical protein
MFGLAGGSLRADLGASPFHVSVRALISIAAWPLYLSRFEPTHTLFRGDALAGWRLPNGRVLPGVAAGVTGLSAVSAGPVVEASLTVPAGRWSIEVGADLSIYLAGAARSGFSGVVTVRQGQSGTRPQAAGK